MIHVILMLLFEFIDHLPLVFVIFFILVNTQPLIFLVVLSILILCISAMILSVSVIGWIYDTFYRKLGSFTIELFQKLITFEFTLASHFNFSCSRATTCNMVDLLFSWNHMCVFEIHVSNRGRVGIFRKTLNFYCEVLDSSLRLWFLLMIIRVNEWFITDNI